MKNFNLPFSIKSKQKDYVLSKLYKEKTESYLLKIPAKTQIESPITILLKPSTGKLNFHININMEKGSSATIIEDWNSEVRCKHVKYTSNIICDANSNLKYVVLNTAPNNTNLEISRTTDIQNDAKCHIYAYHFGSNKVNSQVIQKASGKRSEVHTYTIVKSTKQQELNFNTEHIYIGKEGSGKIEMKGIAENKAILSFKGMINITHTGSGSTGYLNQETLNLSENTVVKAIPVLKIDTNDVKAGHSSSIRNLNNEDLYYFETRGIAKDEAKYLLISGFLKKEIQNIKYLTKTYERIKKLV